MQHAVRKVPGLLHRDLKPANILVNDRVRAMVTDFGLVHAEDAGAGTPAYMAPEQWRLEALDTRTDIYAYGCILYEIFTGHRMYAAHTEAEWEAAHLTQLPITPISFNPSLPTQISAFILRCIEKQPAYRPTDWDEVVLESARWFHEMTGQPVVFDFSADVLTVNELRNAILSLKILGNFAEEVDVCDRLLILDPNNRQAWHLNGDALNALNRHEEAIKAYKRVMEIDLSNDGYQDDGVLLSMGDILQTLNRHQDAISAYDQALNIWRDIIYCDDDKVLETLDEELDNDAPYAACWYMKGSILQDTDHDEEAISAYDQYLLTNPNNTEVWIRKATLLYELNRYDETLAAYEKILTLDPNQSIAWVRRGETLSSLNRDEEALESFNRAISLEPSNGEAWLCKGYALYNLHRYDEALLAYDRANELAIALDPSDTHVLDVKGCKLKDLSRYEEALPIYERIITISPNDTFAWIDKAEVLYKLNRYEESLAEYDKVLTVWPDDEMAVDGKKIVLQKLHSS
jgi:tetratricopeptide (TPR) repeat protein